MNQPSLFDAPRARTTDPATSHAAADVVRPRIGSIQRQVLNAFHRLGPMTARTAERLPIFDAYGFSTIRKRISELCRAGYLDIEGIDNSKRAPASIYRRSDKPLP